MILLGAETVTRQRFEVSRGEDGRTTKTLVDETSVRASVQPLDDRQRAALPEGVRQSVDLRLFSKAEFRTTNQYTNTPADRVVIDGEVFRVIQVKEWRQLLAHFEVDVQRLTEPDDPEWGLEENDD